MNNRRIPRQLRYAAACAVLCSGIGLTLPAAGALAEGSSSGSPQPDATNSAAEPRAKDALLFRNGDLVYGALLSIDAQDGIRWQHPDAVGIIDFGLDHVDEIQFQYRARYDTRTTNACRLRLTNQDELEGNLASLGADKIVLETWYAGAINLARNQVQWIMPVPPPAAVIYAGPTGLDGWTIGKVTVGLLETGVWRYKNGAFYATRAASIARDLKLPDTASVQFDVAWKDSLHLAVAVYTDYLQPISLATKETEPDFSEFYSLQLNNSLADLMPIKKNEIPIRHLGQAYVPAFDQKTTAHMEIRASKPKRVVALLVDGGLVKQWVDPEAFVGTGTGMRFVHQGQGAVKLSNLRVTEWDGQFEEKPASPANLGEDLARLRNGDKVPGHIDALRDGRITVATAASKLAIPWNRVRLIELAGANAERHAAAPGDVRGFFGDGGSVTFHLEKWDTHGVAASSTVFGKAVFDPSAFSRIQFILPRLLQNSPPR